MGTLKRLPEGAGAGFPPLQPLPVTMPIILTSGSHILSITRFTSLNLPRERIGLPTTTFSAYGSPQKEGTFYEPKHVWNLEFRLNETERGTLDRLHAYWLLTAPTPTLTIDDLETLFTEPTTRTRALATGADPEETVDGMVEYFAQFQGVFSTEPKYAKDGAFMNCTVQITETEKTDPS